MHKLFALLTGVAALSGFASMASAQEFCGAEGAQMWIAGDEAQSDLAVAETPFDRNIAIGEGKALQVAFTLSQEMAVRLEADGTQAGDPVIALSNDQGVLLVEDDDGGAGSAARIERNLAPGNYCLTTRGFSDGAVTGILRIARADMAQLTELDPGELSPADACAPGAEATFIAIPDLGALAGQGIARTQIASESRAFRFELPAPTKLTVEAIGESADPEITLFDGLGEELGSNDDYDGLNARLDLTDDLIAGAYCVAMTYHSDASSDVTLRLSQYDAEAALRRLYAEGEAVPPLDGDYPIDDLGEVSVAVTRALVPGRDAYWFRFELPDDGYLLVDAVAAGDYDPVIGIFDQRGRPVASDDDGGEGTNARAFLRLASGTYYLALYRSVSGGFGLSTIVLERFMPVTGP